MPLIRHSKHLDLMMLMFLMGMASAIWMVPLGALLQAYGYTSLWPFVFATMATASLISPLIFGALADRHFSPIIVLRWLCLASAFLMTAAALAIKGHSSTLPLLLLIQLLSLCTAPQASIITSIVFLRLREAKSDFGPIRSLGAIGWVAGCWLVSLCGADGSYISGILGALSLLLLSGITFFLPKTPPIPSEDHLSWQERLGLDALILLKNPNHRVLFLTSALLSIPLSVFYPVTPLYLRELGFEHTSALMTLGQVLEIGASISLARLCIRWPLKRIFLLGLFASVLRFLFCAIHGKTWVLLGIALHGISFAFFFVTAQIYLGIRIETSWQVRAQALFGVMTNGVGNLVGFLASGWWFHLCTQAGSTRWGIFWSGCAAIALLITLYFLSCYHDRSRRESISSD